MNSISRPLKVKLIQEEMTIDGWIPEIETKGNEIKPLGLENDS